MGLLGDYGLDESAETWDDVKKECKKLPEEEVDEILSRRRRRGDPSREWKMWQSGLKWRQGVLRGDDTRDGWYEDVVEKFDEIKEEYHLYQYLQQDELDWLICTVEDLIAKLDRRESG
jgi:hypothetical protein